MNRRKAHYKGFSLIEALVALVAAVMALTVVFAIYDRARRASDSITQKLDSSLLPSEILQRIAEDIDRLAGPGAAAAITIANGFQSGLPAAQLAVSSYIRDKDGQQQILEKVVWQTDYDMPTGRLILYRSHSGMIWEDNLLDKEQRFDWTPDRQLFVPLCTGISFFKVQVPQPKEITANATDPNQRVFARSQNRYDQIVEEQKFFDVWNQPQLPPAILITISFAAPIEGRGVGGAEVPDEQKIKRTVVINRSKKMNFVYVPLDQRDANLPWDANSATTAVRQSYDRTQDQMQFYDGSSGRPQAASSHPTTAAEETEDSGTEAYDSKIMKKYKRYNGRHGIVLLITLVVLVVLASMGYVLTMRVSSQVHRNQYLIDYQNARYACDSGLKYAMVSLESGMTAKLIDRPNDPDFSDVFSYTQEQYERFLAEWAADHPPRGDQTTNNMDRDGQHAMPMIVGIGTTTNRTILAWRYE